MSASRRALLGALLLAGCAGGEGALRTNFPPLRYDYLLKLVLSVGSVDVAEPPPPSGLEAQDPAPPGAALVQMAQDRLVAGGSANRALFSVEAAQIAQARGGLEGRLAVRLDIVANDGSRLGFATAQVTRQFVGGTDDLRGALYDLTSQMMADMNVEFEYQVRRSLRPFLQDPGTAPAPESVDQQPLSAPSRPENLL